MSDTENLNGIRVVSAIADKHKLVLYKEDGKTLSIKQGDPRLAVLLEQIMPIVNRHEVAVISLENFTVYADFEEESGGIVKFFKVAKNKFKGWFGNKDEPENEWVNLPEPEVTSTPAQEATSTTNTDSSYAVNAVVADEVVPVATPRKVVERKPEMVASYHSRSVIQESDKSSVDTAPTEEETIVAVINGVHIPGMEKIKHLIEHATKTNSTIGVQRFLERLASVIEKRKHSVEDVLRFLEKADLPIADDGSIIAYKILKNKIGNPGYYVDCHTGKVQQRIGSYVCVNENLIDLNRDVECSSGLHIARRKYLGNFNGDVCMLTKVAPEDVMTVPHRDPNKVRVKGYHILAELSREAWTKLRNNTGMTDIAEAKQLVADAIAGRHINRIEEVRINGQSGENVVITPLAEPVKEDSTNDLSRAETLENNSSEVNLDAPHVNPRDINKRVNEEIEKSNSTPEVIPLTKEELKETVNETSSVSEEAVTPEPIDLDEEEMVSTIESTGTTPVTEVLETKQERKRRLDRERRAAKKASKSEPKAKQSVKKESKKADPKSKPVKKETSSSKPQAKTKANKPASKSGKEIMTGNTFTKAQSDVLKLHKQGMSPTEISKQTGVPRGTLSGWIKKFS